MNTPPVGEFEQLAGADLVLERVYCGGTAGNSGDDPLSRLLPVGNQGGFRTLGRPSKDAVRLAVLYTSGAEPDWPDALDVHTGVFTYFGDNRSPGRELHDTPKKGNLLLSRVFDWAHQGVSERGRVPPFLLFDKAGPERDVRFRGLRSAPDYFSRRRRVLHRALGYAVRKKRLDANPVSKDNLPESWTAPESPEDAIDPRCVGTPSLIAAMLVACSYVGRAQGPRFVAFYGCMYYAMMRPSEVAALTKDGCYLPDKGWGYLTFADSSPAAGRAFTDDGKVHEHRGLKGRTKGRPNIDPRARRPARRVPIPPELVALLREHIARSGAGPGGRLFRSQNGNPILPSTWWHVWQKTRAIALTPAQAATPLLRRPYDLRHSVVTWRLNSGVPPRWPPGQGTASRC